MTPKTPSTTSLEIKKLVKSDFLGLQVSQTQLFEDILQDAVEQPYFNSLISTIFAVVSTLLAGFGIFSIMSYVSNQRVGETAIRIALGAGRKDILLHSVRKTLLPQVIPLLLGWLLSFFLSKFISTLLYGIDRLNFSVYLEAAGILIIIAVIASMQPLIHLARTNPALILRNN